jgi:hypothetical protein
LAPHPITSYQRSFIFTLLSFAFLLLPPPLAPTQVIFFLFIFPLGESCSPRCCRNSRSQTLQGIGLAKKGIATNALPGWKSGSYGYHGDDGKAFGGSGAGRDFGPTFTTGDIITCIWCQVNRTISYAKNGVHLGVAFRDVNEDKLYPTIGLRTKHEEV